MSLVVWLPLIRDLTNQGVGDVTVTGGAIDNSGKLGKCYKVNSSSPITITHSLDSTANFTFAFWMKIPANMATGTGWEQIMVFSAINVAGGSASSTGISWASYDSVKIYDDGKHQWLWAYPNSQFQYDTWHHWVVAHEPSGDGVRCRIYIDGALVGTYNNTTEPLKLISGIIRFGGGISTDYLYFNDIRVYNHTLSPREVAEIAKGLVLHYPLSENITAMNNAYSYPTFDTNNAGGGWNHWGGSGHIGTYGQSTDKNYIFRPNQTYCHWVANGAGATYNYLLYQSPDYEGGYRSVQCICKEENGIEITNDVVYATWNNRSGGIPNNSWTSITPLGNGFYWCKAEGVMQDGNNDLIGFYVKPGYKVYFSEAYLENGKEICADPFLTDRTTIYDTSGFGNNGTVNNDPTSSFDTPRYLLSICLDGVNQTVQMPNLSTLITDGIFTANIWFKKVTDGWGTKSYETIFGGPSGFELEGKNSGTNSPVIRAYNWGGATFEYTLDAWHMLTMVRTTESTNFYLDGQLKLTGTAGTIPSGNYFLGSWRDTTSQNYKGQLSDFRLYATALTADQVKQLYEAPISLANNGTLFANEFNET